MGGGRGGARPATLSVQRCTAALRSLAGARLWVRALALLAEMRRRGPQPNVICYNAALAACSRAPAADSAIALLREISCMRLAPDTISYNATITACGRGHRWHVALALLEELSCQHVDASVATFGAAISACERVSRWEDALELLRGTRHAAIDPNVFIYSSAINACGRGRCWEVALRLYDEARQSLLMLDTITYNCAISACSKGFQWEWTLVLLSDLLLCKLEPDSLTLSTVAGACAAGRARELAAELHPKAHWPREVGTLWVQEKKQEACQVFAADGGDSGDGSSTPLAVPIPSVDNHEPDRFDIARGRANGHAPVLCEPVVEALVEAGGLDGAYADCTFGRGGHTRALLARLSPRGRVFAFDVDPAAVAEARRLAARDPRLEPLHRPFGELADALPAGVQLAGALADLGVSSPQLDQGHRGFSVLADGPLDLRMNPRVGIPAAEWLAGVSAEELAWVLREYGEDGDPLLAARIAQAVAARVRRQPPLIRTRQLSEVVRAVKTNVAENAFEQPARLTFQAIRTHLNNEFQQLERLVGAALERLAVGGRLAIICFKRPEVATARRVLRRNEECHPSAVEGWPRSCLARLYPLLARSPAPDWCAAEACAPLLPSAMEVRANTRARSAQALIFEKRTRRVWI